MPPCRPRPKSSPASRQGTEGSCSESRSRKPDPAPSATPKSRSLRSNALGRHRPRCRDGHSNKGDGPGQRSGGDGGESNSPSKNLLRRPLRACPIVCRRTLGRPSATCRALQSRSLAGFSPGYATLPGTAPPLNDASTAHGGEAASTLTLLPKQRGREQTGCCQLLRLGSFLRGLESNLGSRSPVAGPCRNHASPQSHRPSAPAGIGSAQRRAPADCTAGTKRGNPGLAPGSGRARPTAAEGSRTWSSGPGAAWLSRRGASPATRPDPPPASGSAPGLAPGLASGPPWGPGPGPIRRSATGR